MVLTAFTGSRYVPLNNAGRIEPGGTLTFYRAGTREPKDVYEDAEGDTAFEDGIVTLDAQGGALVFLDNDEAYDVVFKGANGQRLWTIDAVAATDPTLPIAPSFDFELFAGGGGGGASTTGNGGGGGGGAGGRETDTMVVTPGVAIPIVIGAGGAERAAGSGLVGNDGADSSVGAITATKGGGGGKHDGDGRPGGSGGGGGYNNTAGGLGTVGQGYDGGDSNHPSGQGGGGGGAGGEGETGQTTADGGIGVESPSPREPGRRGGGGAGNGGVGVDGGGSTHAPGTLAGAGGGGGDSDTFPGAAGFRGELEIWFSDDYERPTSTTGSPTYTHVAGYHVYTWETVGTWEVVF